MHSSRLEGTAVQGLTAGARRRGCSLAAHSSPPAVPLLCCAGTPPTAGSASRCTGPLPDPFGRNAVTVQPFSLLRVSKRAATSCAWACAVRSCRWALLRS